MPYFRTAIINTSALVFSLVCSVPAMAQQVSQPTFRPSVGYTPQQLEAMHKQAYENSIRQLQAAPDAAQGSLEWTFGNCNALIALLPNKDQAIGYQKKMYELSLKNPSATSLTASKRFLMVFNELNNTLKSNPNAATDPRYQQIVQMTQASCQQLGIL